MKNILRLSNSLSHHNTLLMGKIHSTFFFLLDSAVAAFVLKRFPKNLISAFEKNGAILPKLHIFRNFSVLNFDY